MSLRCINMRTTIKLIHIITAHYKLSVCYRHIINCQLQHCIWTQNGLSITLHKLCISNQVRSSFCICQYSKYKLMSQQYSPLFCLCQMFDLFYFLVCFCHIHSLNFHAIIVLKQQKKSPLHFICSCCNVIEHSENSIFFRIQCSFRKKAINNCIDWNPIWRLWHMNIKKRSIFAVRLLIHWLG